MKRCARCGQGKPLADFNRSRTARDGRQSYCRPCQLTANKEWQSTNRATVNAYGYAALQRQPEAVRGAKRRWKQRNREAVRAHHSVRKALRSGRLVKPDHCESCQVQVEPRRLHAHHEDYSRRLDVRWLCAACHAKLIEGRPRKEHVPEAVGC